jgi:hypothetical protein
MLCVPISPSILDLNTLKRDDKPLGDLPFLNNEQLLNNIIKLALALVSVAKLAKLKLLLGLVPTVLMLLQVVLLLN